MVQEQLILFLENMVLVDLLFAQCNDEMELANRGGYVKSQRERGAKKGAEGGEREHRRGRTDREEELCIIIVGRNKIFMQIHLSEHKFCSSSGKEHFCFTL